MLRLNLFTEVRTMESVLDERTELDTLHRFYDYITGSMRLMGLPIYLLVLVCLNRSDAMPVRCLLYTSSARIPDCFYSSIPFRRFQQIPLFQAGFCFSKSTFNQNLYSLKKQTSKNLPSL